MMITILATFLFQTGCATILSGRKQDIQVTSSPPNANVFVNGELKTTTPGEIILKRKGSYTLSFEKEGYEPVEINLNREINELTFLHLLSVVGVWFAVRGELQGADGHLSFLFYNTISPLIVDLFTGAAFKQNPAELYIELP